MKQLLENLQASLRRGQSAAWTALVETRGSTPQKAGAAMLVFPDGSQVGTLGGGCVEAEVKRRSLQLGDQGDREILSFKLDSDYGWDDGLICGGRMKMLVDPVRPDDDNSYYDALDELVTAGQAFTEAVALSDVGTSKAADRFLFDANSQLVATRGSGEMNDSIIENLRPVSSRPRAYVSEQVAYLPVLERCRLLIVGAGHVGQKVAELAAQVDFDVWVVDDRAEYCNEDRFPVAQRRIVGPIDNALSGLEIDSGTYCVIVTRGHNHDEEALYHLAETSAGYVGMIGSRRKIRLIFQDLIREGIDPAALERVRAPLGFEIGSQTVPEIAVSIVAELVANRNLDAIPESLRRNSLMDDLTSRRQLP